MNVLALLTGIVLVPVGALVLGRRFRHRSPRQRTLFWGLLTGYGVAVIAVSVALLLDPVHWDGDASWRSAMAWWGLSVGAFLGALTGAAWRVAPPPNRTRPGSRPRS